MLHPVRNNSHVAGIPNSGAVAHIRATKPGRATAKASTIRPDPNRLVYGPEDNPPFGRDVLVVTMA